MHDIRIFLEDNGQFWAVATLGKEKVYGIGHTQNELIASLKTWIELSNSVYHQLKELNLRIFFKPKYATQIQRNPKNT